MSTDVIHSAPPKAADRQDIEDPRDQIEIGVLLPNGRLAALHFASRDEAEEWARPEEGEQVVEYNILSECSFNSC